MENKEIKGIIHSIESFGSVDGPGVRYIAAVCVADTAIIPTHGL